MTQRERMLLMGVIAVLALWAGYKGLQWRQGVSADLEDERRSVNRKIDEAKLAMLRSDQAARNLEGWQEQSLPSDPQVAQTDYRAWLMDRLNEAGLDFSNVRRIGTQRDGEAFTSVSYAAHAEGELGDLTKFLHSFYQTPQLHKLTRLKIDPIPDEQRIAIDMTFEALIVDGATRTSGIAEGDSGRLALDGLAAYVESVEGRNLFAPYVPPPPPKRDPPKVVERRPPPKPPFDDAKHAHFTGIVGKGDSQQAWISVRTTGKTLFVSEGDTVEVGQFSAQVREIDPGRRTLLLEAEGGLYRVGFGKSLREGEPVEEPAIL